MQVRTQARKKDSSEQKEIFEAPDGVNWRHCFKATGIDMEKTHEDARNRMDDGRWTWGTVIHDHASNVPCKGGEHTIYDPRDKSVAYNVFIDDGYVMWGIRDPFVKEK